MCDNCNGRCRVKSYKELAVEFEVALALEALSTANVLGSRTLHAKGQIVIDQRFSSGEKPAAVPSEVSDRVTELLRQAHAAGGSETCVLFQHLQVEEVPVCEVVYEYRGPPERRLWVYGRQHLLYAPGVPRPWGKIAWLCVGMVLASLGAVWAVFLLS